MGTQPVESGETSYSPFPAQTHIRESFKPGQVLLVKSTKKLRCQNQMVLDRSEVDELAICAQATEWSSQL